MKKLLLLPVLIFMALQAFCQYNTRPTRSRFYNSKVSTFSVKNGDIILYAASKDSQQYSVVVNLTAFGDSITFNYVMPEIDVQGNILIEPMAVKEATKYDTILSAEKTRLPDASIFWLSKKNFSELAAVKETMMDVGNGQETFKRQSVGTLKINFKGKEKIVTVYNIENTNEKAKKRLTVLSEENNPLILKTDFGWQLTLKEVR